jgi:hypothetical protein
MGRPLKEINWDLVDKLIEAGCSGVAISGKFRIQSDTFYARFKKEYGCSFQDYRADVQEAGIADLMMMLHAKALNNKAPGNSNLLIFLAKTKLGMKEPETTNLVAPNQTGIDQSHIIMQLQNRVLELEGGEDSTKTD